MINWTVINVRIERTDLLTRGPLPSVTVHIDQGEVPQVFQIQARCLSTRPLGPILKASTTSADTPLVLRFFTVLSLLAVTGCSVLESEPALPTWEDFKVDIDCTIDVQIDGEIDYKGGDVTVAEGEYFAIIINRQNLNEGLFSSVIEEKPFVDIANSNVEVTNAHLVADDQGGHMSQGGTPRSLEPDTFFTRVKTDDFGEILVLDLPPATYDLLGPKNAVGQAGTCPKPLL